MQVSAQQWQLTARVSGPQATVRPLPAPPSSGQADATVAEARPRAHQTPALQGEYLQRQLYTGQTVFADELDFAVRSALQTYTETASLGTRQGRSELMHIDLYI